VRRPPAKAATATPSGDNATVDQTTHPGDACARCSRRTLLAAGAATAAALLLGPVGGAAARPEARAGNDRAGTVLEVHGFHAAPDRGGGQKVDLQVADMRALGARSVVVVLPTEEYIGKAADARLQVITRLHFNNLDEVRWVTHQQLAVHRGVQTPVFQVGNEIDQEPFGGVVISPEQFAREVFVPVVGAARDTGAKLLIPPMAPGSPTEDGYLNQLLAAIARLLPPDVIRESLGLCIHNYYTPGQDPLARVQRIFRQASAIVGPLPIYITEAGLNQDRTRFYPDAVIRDEVLKYLGQPTDDLPIATNNWWLLGNRVFRGPPLPEHLAVFEDFETSAWRRAPDAVAPVYDAVARLARPADGVRGPRPAPR
jgi:hypothetical protein